MRRSFAVTAALIFVAVSSALAAGAPRLHLVSISPAVVRGTNFHPAERITVRLSVNGTGTAYTRTVRATAAGTFRAPFRRVSVNPCPGYVITAKGNLGSRAKLRSSPFVDCAQP